MFNVQPMGLGSRIRHYRLKAGLTLAELAELSQVDVGTISALEQRDSSRSQYFSQLAMALGMSVEDLGNADWDGSLTVLRDNFGKAREVHLAGPRPFPGGRQFGVPGRDYVAGKDAFDAPMQARAVADPRAAFGMEPILAWEHLEDLPEGEFVMVPRLDVHLSAGAGREQVEIELVKENPQAFRAEWIRLMRLKPNKLAAMRASGESMEPTIHDGDSLLVDTSQTSVNDGKVYALWYDGGERVKRLFRLPGGGLRIVSDNAKHPSIEVGPDYSEHVRIIGRVVHRSGIGGL